MRSYVKGWKSSRSGKNGLVGSLSVLISSTALSQVVLLLTSMAIARLYTPTEVGQLAVVVSVATMLTIVMGSTYQRAIPLAQTDDEARTVAWLAILLALAGGFILVLALGVAHVLAKDRAFGLGSHLLLIAIVAGVSIAVWSTLKSLLLRIGSVGTVGAATVTGNATQGTAQIAAGFAGLGSTGLAWGFVLGRLTSSFRMLRKAHLGRPPSWRTLRATEQHWRWQSGLLLIPAVLTLLTVNATAPLLALMFGAAFAGYWSLAVQFTAVPNALLGQTVSSMSLPETARRLREGQPVRDLTWGLLLGLLLGGMPAFATLALLGPELFSWLLGDEWREAGVIAAILAPWLALNIGSSIMSQVATVLQRFTFIAVFAVIDSITRMGALVGGWLLDSGIAAVALYSVAAFTTSIVWIYWGLKEVAVERATISRFMSIVLGVLLTVAATAATRVLLPSPAYIGVCILVIAVLGIAALLWFRRNLRGRFPTHSAPEPGTDHLSGE